MLNSQLIMKTFILIIFKIIFFYSNVISAEVKVTGLYAESGPVSEIAEAIAEAKRVVVETINADGIGIVGRGLITIDKVDTACDPVKAKTNLRDYLKKNNPEILLGPTCSSSALKVIEDITIPKKILTMSSSASYPLLSSIEDNDLFFRTIPSDIQQSTSIANYLISKNIRQIILLYGDDSYNSTLAQNFLKVFTEEGGLVLFNTLLTDKTVINQSFINTFVDIAIANDQPGLVMFLHGNQRTVNLLEQFTNTVLSRLQELQTSNIFKHQYGSDSMLTNEVKDLIYSYIPIQLNERTTIIAQATSQSSEEFQSYANIMLNAGVDPNSPYSAISFDTMMLAALALQHQAHNNYSKDDLSKSLVSVANPPGIAVGPGSWEAARALLLRGIEINYEGVSGSLDFDINGDVEGLYSLNQVTEDNLWSVEPLEKLHPFEPRIIID